MIFKRIKRKSIIKKPFPREWIGIIKKNVLLYNKLPGALQKELFDHIQIFISEKNFEGCGGLIINDEIKVTISAQACILLLNRTMDYYSKLISILVYPTTYVAPKKVINKIGVVEEREQLTLGQSSLKGIVILAWDDVLKGGRYLHDGKNLIMHEFAHQLDAEDIVYNGVPILATKSQYMIWAKVMSKSFERLIENTRDGKKTFLRKYGSSDPAEFFAVATEYFFEKPKQMLKKEPDLYNELKNFYKQDPSTYF